MPERTYHRGEHPKDKVLFAEPQIPTLRQATTELSWLLSRGYAERAALKLVGDHHALAARQRLAALRCACSDQALTERQRRRCELRPGMEQPIHIDGLNCIIIVETALSGGVLLRGRDGAHRDLASVHGTYRMVSETPRALDLLGAVLEGAQATFWLDQPVSNSGKLATKLRQLALLRGWSWRVELVHNPDRELPRQGGIVASADAVVLDHCNNWVDLPGAVIARSLPHVRVIDLGSSAHL